jgi:PAS domain S-box-containing protein
MHHSLRTRILLFTFGIIVITTAFSLWMTRSEVDSAMTGAEQESAKNALNLAMLHIESEYAGLLADKAAMIEAHKKRLKDVVGVQAANIRNLYRQVEASGGDAEAVRQRFLQDLTKIRFGNDGYFWVADYHARNLAHPDPNVMGSDFSAIRDIKGDRFVPAMVALARTQGAGFYSYWWRRLGRKGPSEKISYVTSIPELRWVIGAGVYMDDIEQETGRRFDAFLDDLRRTLARIRVAKTGYLYIFDGNKKMLVHPVLAGRDVSQLKNPATGNFMIDDLIAASKHPDVPFEYPWDLPADPGHYRYPKISYVLHFKPLDWYVASSVYKQEMEAPASDLVRKILFSSAALLALMIVVAVLFGRTLTEPLTRLVGAMKVVAKNGLAAGTVAVSGTSETRELGGIFNTMLGSLHKAQDELEQRVADRTTALSRSNAQLKQEIADREAAEQALRASEQHFRSLIDFLPDAVVIIDRESRVVGWNKAIEAMTGVKAEEMLGKSDYEYALPFYGERRPILVDLVETPDEVLAEKYSNIHRMDNVLYADTYLPLGGRGAYLHGRARILYGPDGSRVGAIEVIHDLTERKQAEEEALAARTAAEAASRAKSEFLATMSHEIRTPMNAIIGMADLLGDSRLTREQREYVATMKSAGENLLQIINDILDLSKVEAGHLELEHSDFDVVRVVEKTVELMAVRAHRKNLELTCRIGPGVPPHLIGDRNRLRQVLVNLLSNAIKFTEQGDVALCVEPERTEGEAISLLFSVSDTGVGVPADKREAIFESFTQADSSTTRKYGGTGLGLAICKRLVELMGGAIRVESEEDKGSTFTFSAVFQRGAAPAAEIASATDIRGLRVLVVDDNAVNRRILLETLAGWGALPEEAEDGPRALACLQQAVDESRPFDVLLLDCRMPGMDGFALADHIRSDRRFASATIMMLTSDDRPGDIARARKAGVGEYLVKPVQRAELFASIIATLSGRERAPEPGVPQGVRTPLPQLSLLVAEDDEINRLVIARILEKEGHRTTLTVDGREALEAFRNNRFDAILMDVQMPGMDGYEATQEIRKREREAGTHVPIIALTAFAFPEDRERCYRAGMDGFVAKPLHREQLFAEIARLLGEQDRKDRNEVFDSAGAIRMAGDDEAFLRELAGVFLRDSPAALQGISEALRMNDGAEVARLAHKIKTELAFFKADAAFPIALRLERAGRQNDRGGIEAAAGELEQEVVRLNQALNEFMQRNKEQEHDG